MGPGGKPPRPIARLAPAAEEPAGPGGLRGEKSSEMALPTVIGTDGRAALPAFTCTASLARWRPQARPVPVPAAQVWRSGAQDASAVIIDIAGPVPFAVDGARLAALAQGRPAPMPYEDPDVIALVHAALAAEPVIAGYRLLPGEDGTDLTLCLVPVPGCDPAEPGVTGAAQRACEQLLAGAGDRVRRGVEVALLAPPGPEPPGLAPPGLAPPGLAPPGLAPPGPEPPGPEPAGGTDGAGAAM
jgi:hypothetical protein